jgi:ABC-type proline/glycine betaine transport system ATPase subunit
MQALPLVHARIEALLNDESDKSARERSLEIIRGALGDEVAEMVLADPYIEDFVSDINRARVLRVRSVMQDLTADKFAGDVDANDNLESLIAASGGDTALRYRVIENGKPVGELDMRELVKALVPRISSSEAGTRYH